MPNPTPGHSPGTLFSLQSRYRTERYIKTSPPSASMNTEIEIQRLLKAKKRIEQKLKEVDQKIDHVLFRLDEEKRCFARECPLDDEDQEPLWPSQE